MPITAEFREIIQRLYSKDKGDLYFHIGTRPHFYRDGKLYTITTGGIGANWPENQQNCEGGPIGDEGAKALAQALKASVNIYRLVLSRNDIKTEGAKALAEALEVNQSLKELYLNEGIIQDEGEVALAKAISTNPRLIRLGTTYTLRGEEPHRLLANGLAANNSLVELRLFNCVATDSSAQAFAAALKVNTSLTKLDLGENLIGDRGVKALAEALKVNRSLVWLSLHANKITDAGAAVLIEMLQINYALRDITLDYNKISQSVLDQISALLKRNDEIQPHHVKEIIARVQSNDPSMTELSLIRQSVNDEVVVALAPALKINRTLTSLLLWLNSIGDDGAIALAEMLKVNRSVTRLDLTHNSIGVDGARALAEMLKVNRSLTSVSLGYNSIGVDGARALAEMLKVNRSLTSLYLVRNPIGDDGARALVDALEANQNLEELNLAGNQIEETTLRRISALLQRNKDLLSEQLKTKVQSDSEAEFEDSEDQLRIFPQEKTPPRLEQEQIQTAFTHGEIPASLIQFVQLMRGREAALEHTLQNAEEALMTHHEQLRIRANPILQEHYNYFVTVMCSIISVSELMRHPGVKNLVDDAIGQGLSIAATVTGAAKRIVTESARIFNVTVTIPGVSETLQVMHNVYELGKSRENRKRAIAVTQFFDASINPRDFIRLLAKQLTLFREAKLMEIAAVPPTRMDLARNAANSLLLDDVSYQVNAQNIPLRQAALKICAVFFDLMLSSVEKEEERKRLENMPMIFRAVMEGIYKIEGDGPDPVYISPLAQGELSELRAVETEVQAGAAKVSDQLEYIEANLERASKKLGERDAPVTYAEREHVDSLHEKLHRLQQDVRTIKKQVDSEKLEEDELCHGSGEMVQAQLQMRLDVSKKNREFIKSIGNYARELNEAVSVFLMAQAEVLERLSNVEDRMGRVEAELGRRSRFRFTLYSRPAASTSDISRLEQRIAEQDRQIAEMKNALRQVKAKP